MGARSEGRSHLFLRMGPWTLISGWPLLRRWEAELGALAPLSLSIRCPPWAACGHRAHGVSWWTQGCWQIRPGVGAAAGTLPLIVPWGGLAGFTPAAPCLGASHGQ